MGNKNCEWRKIRFKNISVYYLLELHGGGATFGQDFITAVKDKIGRVDTICEFACGPGFIGFTLLAYGLCEKLCLIDVSPLAIKTCKKTIKENQLEDRVQVYLSDVLDGVPKSEKWDLVVSNPPHFQGTTEDYKNNELTFDPDWRIHKKFYREIFRHLNKEGSILFQENKMGGSALIWREMISKSKFGFVKVFELKPSGKEKLAAGVKFLYSLYGFDFFRWIQLVASGLKELYPRLISKSYPFYFVWTKKRWIPHGLSKLDPE